MKLKKKLAIRGKPKKDQNRLADEWGETYFALKAQSSLIDEQLTGIKEAVKAAASKSGKKFKEAPKSTVIKGTNFVVGFTQPEPSPLINREKALKYLPRSVFQKVKVISIDTRALQREVEAGNLDAKTFAKMVEYPEKAPSPRVLISRRADFERAAHQKQDTHETE